MKPIACADSTCRQPTASADSTCRHHIDNTSGPPLCFQIEMKKSRGHKRVYELFTQTPIEGVDGGSSLLKQINFRFFRNPVELFPATNDSTRVGSVRFEKTELKGNN